MSRALKASVEIDPDVNERLEKLAASRHRRPDLLLKEAVEQYVEREEKRESFRQDTLHAWEEYQKTGLHLTAEEVEEWLQQLEDGHDIEPPACHA
ncbi:CopG family ribbon-helix-helix protein [Rhizobium jaguaris]|uniref:CopG family transcriptional regulator n=1 Tax=Rhizobium jaguaris TaxID=1312183 RepID=A0A387FQU2_9HYPH|nr:CopG family transcriptional regulator [Rhizobium jaguaris]AYG57622.1 CopG family transcriptional regulator [Rhizobium jaguaris]